MSRSIFTRKLRFWVILTVGLIIFAGIVVVYPPKFLAQVADDCTLYAAVDGNDSNNGTSVTTPKTLSGAINSVTAGSVVCIKGGTYTLSRTQYFTKGGTSLAWITYKAYGDSPVNIIASTNWYAGSGGDEYGLFNVWNGSFWGPSYIQFQGLNMDGQNVTHSGLSCTRSHHLKFVGNNIKNMGTAGISTRMCDYITSEGNTIYHSGYNQGWGSGISYNTNVWYDTNPGFHYIIVNNIISGEFDGSNYHSDGNGIIIDLSADSSYNYSSANTAPSLIANNVIYENGGTCIHGYVVTNMWVVNNTCYKNTLDTSNSFNELGVNNSDYAYFINNIVYAWNNSHYNLFKVNNTSNISFYKNMYFNGKGLNFIPSNASQFILADPKFTNAPSVDLSATGQYANALSPLSLGNKLELQSISPAIGAGIDPTTVSPVVKRKDGTTFVDSGIVTGLQQYVFRDFKGIPRPQDGGFDLGAYEYNGGLFGATPVPTVSTTPTPTATIVPTSQPTQTPTANDTAAPSVSISKPQNGSGYGKKGNFSISVSASDASGVSSIQLLMDGSVFKTCNNSTSCNTNYKLNSLNSGTHTITAKAVDNSANHNATSQSVTITVQ